jgi:hypothetical protein
MFSSPDRIAAISYRYRNAPALARASARARAEGNGVACCNPMSLSGWPRFPKTEAQIVTAVGGSWRKLLPVDGDKTCMLFTVSYTTIPNGLNSLLANFWFQTL